MSDDLQEKQDNATWRHKNLGDVKITVECLAMQLKNPDPTSMFVEHDGEIKEVSRGLVEIVE